MAVRLLEADGRPLVTPCYSEQLSSGVATSRICCKLLISVTVAGNLTIRTLDNAAPTITTLPAGFHQIDVQFDMATWTGTMTAVGLARLS